MRSKKTVSKPSTRNVMSSKPSSMAAPMPLAPSSVPLARRPPLKRSVPTDMYAVGSGSLRTLKLKAPIVWLRPFTSPVTVKVTSCPTVAGRATYLPLPDAVSVPPDMAR